ncbi:hypothetical protein [Streptomyces sp. NPDC046984]|uniref:hypothetical protein n=1 Tax=unclassified Streptomyces TaxID=2593676 RepID=UPI0033E95299
MTDMPPRTPPTTAHHERPFTGHQGQWQKQRAHALRSGHICDGTCSTACEPVPVYERARWGWLAWTIPGDGSLPEIPHQIGVLTPAATRLQRLALRWLTRHPAQRIGLGGIPASVRLSVAAVAVVSLLTGLYAATQGISVDVVLPGILLAPLLTEHLLERLDARALEHVRTVEGDASCRYLQRLAALHSDLVAAALSSDCYELRRAAEIGQHLLWDAAGLLQTQDTLAASDALIARERLMLHLVNQVTQTIGRTASENGATEAGQARAWRPTPPSTHHS